MLFLKIHTDMTVIVQKHPLGADMVRITMLSPHYPSDLLRSQCNELCNELGTQARGLAVTQSSLSPGEGDQFTFVEATFATNGIIKDNGDFHIEPIVKAFAGAPATFTVEGISVDFDGIDPSKTALQRYDVPNVIQAEGRYTNDPPLKGVEYRIKLLTQDPTKIVFPDEFSPATPATTAAAPLKKDSGSSLLVGFIVAALLVGALVYFAMLRVGRRARA